MAKERNSKTLKVNKIVNSRLHLYLTVLLFFFVQFQSFKCNEWNLCDMWICTYMWIEFYFRICIPSFQRLFYLLLFARIFQIVSWLFFTSHWTCNACDCISDDNDKTSVLCVECEFLHDSFDADQVWDCYGWSESKRSADWVAWKHSKKINCARVTVVDMAVVVGDGVALYCHWIVRYFTDTPSLPLTRSENKDQNSHSMFLWSQHHCVVCSHRSKFIT